MDCKSIIPCTSSSSTTWRHDVFVSFRGEDTRNNFTDHLFAALKRKHLVTFRDDNNLEKGESISAELMQAIEQSRVFIVVFSKNYATSTWCLQELSKIVDCNKVTGQIILPVFLDVDPSEVRKQIGNYGKAFSKHEERYKENLEMVQRWRETLEQVANLSGWDVLNKPQHGEIEKIVEKVISMSGNKLSSQLDGLVGIHTRYKQLEKLLILDSSDDVRVVGICGLGGIGKTTLARALYDGIFHQYDASCFIDDVSKVYGDYGLIGVHKQLLCQILNDENPEIWNLSKANYLIKTRLCHMKALVIFDNVDKIEQMQKFAMIREWLCAGSRIIITSRDEHVLSEYGVDKIYNVQLLNHDEAYQLFCRKAFKCDYIMSCEDIMREYEELTYRVLEYAQGLPLAIEVLGSFLYGRNISEWRSALDRLKDNPKKEIMDVLQMSFDGLEQMEKEIFLNIACFFDNSLDLETYVKRVLSCCGLYPDIGIKVLINKSLITIRFGNIRMHDMLVELGKKIVREKAPNEPGKWSRLWLHEDFLSVMYNKMVMENLEAIKLLLPESTSEMTTFRAEALSKMSGLKLLILKNINFSGSLNCLSNELRYLEWEKYPFTYFPSRCELTKLVELVLPYSSIKQLWEGIKPLYNLRVMDLHHSRNLIKTPDFRRMPKLEELNLEDCTKLVEINPSIGHLEKLIHLNLENCTSLTSLPNSLFSVSSLKVLNLSGCSKLFKDQLLKKAKHLKEFEVDSPIVQCQSASFIFKKRLKLMLPLHFFYSRRHNDIVGSLIPSLPRFPSLRDLDLSFCNLLKIPEAIVLLHCLESLNLGGNNFVTLPCSIRELPRLTFLNLEHCKQLTSLSELSLRTVFPIPKEASPWVAGFYIFDCPKLVEMESWTSIALSWMIQFLQLKKEYSPDVTIVIPGTQIPRWFNHQSVGHSINLEPLPDVHDNNWIGVAFCAAFVAHDHPTNLSNPNKLHELGCYIEYQGLGSGCLIPIRLEKDLVTVEWAHLCLHYFPRELFIRVMGWVTEDKHDLDGFILTMNNFGNSIQGLRVEVKNCGMRLVYRQDLEELNSTVTNDALRIGIEPSHSEI